MTWIEDLTGVKTVRFDGETVATRAKLNFLGDGVTVADNAGSGQTDVTVLSGGTAVYVTDLTALAGTVDRARVYCDGYYARYDGGGGTFVWHAGSSTTANGGTVLGAGTGRWKRVFSGSVNVRWFGAKGDGVANDTTSINAAIATGLAVEFPAGTYICQGLTQTANNQRLFSKQERAILSKRANGEILTSTGDYLCLENIQFYGAGATYTGNNVSIAGNYPKIIDCVSNEAAGRALLATGQQVTVNNGQFATYATGSNAYDLEIGIYGTPTLYHTLTNCRANQHTGGLLLVETGAASVLGCEIGKLKWDPGAGGVGSVAGRTVSCRIGGDVTVNQSNSIFSSNHFAVLNITFGVGTSQHTLDASNNTRAVSSITNNGNGNSLIVREVSVGGTNKIKVGGDSSVAIFDIDTTAGELILPGTVYVKNNKAVGLRNAADSGNAVSLSTNSSDTAFLAAYGSYFQISSAGLLQLFAGTGYGVKMESHLVRTRDLNIVASTTQTQAAGVALGLTGDILHVATVANANDTIALPAAPSTAYGREVLVLNRGAATLKIYPYTGDNLGAGVNASVTLAAGGTARFFAYDETNWAQY